MNNRFVRQLVQYQLPMMLGYHGGDESVFELIDELLFKLKPAVILDQRLKEGLEFIPWVGRIPYIEDIESPTYRLLERAQEQKIRVTSLKHRSPPEISLAATQLYHERCIVDQLQRMHHPQWVAVIEDIYLRPSSLLLTQLGQPVTYIRAAVLEEQLRRI